MGLDAGSSVIEAESAAAVGASLSCMIVIFETAILLIIEEVSMIFTSITRSCGAGLSLVLINFMSEIAFSNSAFGRLAFSVMIILPAFEVSLTISNFEASTRSVRRSSPEFAFVSVMIASFILALSGSVITVSVSAIFTPGPSSLNVVLYPVPISALSFPSRSILGGLKINTGLTLIVVSAVLLSYMPSLTVILMRRLSADM